MYKMKAKRCMCMKYMELIRNLGATDLQILRNKNKTWYCIAAV
jgi:hypothetical protein